MLYPPIDKYNKKQIKDKRNKQKTRNTSYFITKYGGGGTTYIFTDNKLNNLNLK